MKLTWHLIAKDFRRLRWALAAWLALFVLQVAAGFMLLRGNGGDMDRPVVLQLTGAALVLVQMLAGYVLVSRLVHEDRLVDGNALWRTQPISSRRLLTAKLLGAGLMFGAAPVLLMVPWWLCCGFGGAELGRAALTALGWQVCMIVLGMWLASITDGIGRFLLWTLVLLAAAITAELTFALPGATQSRPDVGADLFATRQLLALGVLMATGLAVVALQYLGRHVRRSIALSVTGFLLAVLVLAHWPWAVAPSGPSFAAPSSTVAPFPTDDIGVTLGRSVISTGNPRLSLSGVTLRYRLNPVPADAGVLGFLVRHTWTMPDGLVIERASPFNVGWSTGGFPSRLGPALGLPEPPKDPETEAWMRSLHDRARTASATREQNRALVDQGENMLLPTSSLREVHTLIWLPASIAQRIARERPAYRASVDVVLTRAEALVSFPLADRRSHPYEAQTLRVTDTWREKDGQLEASVVATVPSWQADARQSLSRLIGTMQVDAYRSPHTLTAIDVPFVVNRRTGEYRLLNGRGRAVAQFCGVIVSLGRFQVLAPKVRRGDKWVVRDADWFDGTELWVVRARGATRFERNIAVDHFDLVTRNGVRTEARED